MTDLRQAAQQALEALEGWEHCDKWVWPVTALEQAKRNTTESLAALRTALEQQAEPVAWMDREGDLYKMPEIPEWAPPHTMLYTTPPQRQWQGMTDEEIGQAWSVADGEHNASAAVKRRITRAIEAKLKEKHT